MKVNMFSCDFLNEAIKNHHNNFLEQRDEFQQWLQSAIEEFSDEDDFFLKQETLKSCIEVIKKIDFENPLDHWTYIKIVTLFNLLLDLEESSFEEIYNEILDGEFSPLLIKIGRELQESQNTADHEKNIEKNINDELNLFFNEAIKESLQFFNFHHSKNKDLHQVLVDEELIGDTENYLRIGHPASLVDKNHKVIDLKSHCYQDVNFVYISNNEEESKHIVSRIKQAIDIYLKLDEPIFCQMLKNLNTYFIPLREDYLVSHSSQFLPKHSCINFFNRDDIDLLDDLIHESGHHYLNLFLAHEELIIEDDEKIFYSPWREAYRPIRGLFHAVVTFNFALHLFASLIRSFHHLQEVNALNFNLDLKKICFRFLEEYYSIERTLKDCFLAYELKKITDEGMLFVSFVKEHMSSCEELVSYALEQIDHEQKEKINNLQSKISKMNLKKV